VGGGGWLVEARPTPLAPPPSPPLSRANVRCAFLLWLLVLREPRDMGRFLVGGSCVAGEVKRVLGRTRDVIWLLITIL